MSETSSSCPLGCNSRPAVVRLKKFLVGFAARAVRRGSGKRSRDTSLAVWAVPPCFGVVATGCPYAAPALS